LVGSVKLRPCLAEDEYRVVADSENVITFNNLLLPILIKAKDVEALSFLLRQEYIALTT
jgi:hypothetical protein